MFCSVSCGFAPAGERVGLTAGRQRFIHEDAIFRHGGAERFGDRLRRERAAHAQRCVLCCGTRARARRVDALAQRLERGEANCRQPGISRGRARRPPSTATASP